MNSMPTFSWGAVTGANYYDVQIDDLTTGQMQVLRNSHVNGLSWTAARPLQLGQDYQWEARAWTTSGTSSAWAYQTFTIVNPFAGSYTGSFSGNTTEGPVSGSVAATVDGSGVVAVSMPGPGSGHVDLSGNTLMTGTFGFGTVQDAAYTFTGTLTVAAGAVNGNGGWTATWAGGSGSGTWTVSAATLAGTPLDAPSPGLPNATITNATPTFTWGMVTGAAYYDVWVDDVTTGQSQVLRNAHDLANTWTPTTPLTLGHDYQWCVRALDNSGDTSPVSGPTAFTLGFLGTPTNLGGAIGPITTTNPSLTWDSVTNAGSYEVWVHDVSTGLTVMDKKVTTTTVSPVLTLGHSYEWRVKALSSGNFGPWGDPAYFSIIVASPSPVAPASAAPNAKPSFSWNSVANAGYYDVRVDDTTTGQVSVQRNSHVVGTSWLPATPFVPGHNYQWWVRAVAASGVSSTWSSASTFFVTPLAKPASIAPAGLIQDTTPTLSWNAVAGADYYDLWVKDVTTGGTQVLRKTHVVGASLTLTSALTPGHDYQWLVRALSNNGDSSVWSDATVFTLASPFAGAYTGSFSGDTTEGPVSGTVNGTISAGGAITVTDPGSGHGTVNFSGGATITGQGIGSVQEATYTFVGTFVLAGGVATGTGTWTANWPGGSGHGTWSVQSTRIVGAPLDTPVLTGPIGSTVDTRPRFTWNAVPGADYYDIWVDDTTTGASQVLRNQHVTATFWTPATSLTAGHSYRWKVEAFSNNGAASAWSSTATFSIARLTTPPFAFHAFDDVGTEPTPQLVSYTDKSGNNVQVLAFPGQVEVFAVSSTPEATMQDLIEANNGTILAQVPYLGYYVAAVTPGNEATFITALEVDPSVLFAIPETTMQRGAAGYVDMNTLEGANGQLATTLGASGTVAPGVNLYVMDDYLNAYVSTGNTHGSEVSYVASQGLPNPALGINIVSNALPADSPVPPSHWASAFALITQQLAANPSARAVINVSIEAGGLDDDSYKQALLETFRTYATLLEDVKTHDPSLYDRMAIVAIAGNGGLNIDNVIQQLHADPQVADVFQESAAPSQQGPHMLIVGGTNAGGDGVNYSFNYALDSSYMLYAPSTSVVIDQQGHTSPGTSFAAPAVCNLIARLLAANPKASVTQVTWALMQAAQAGTYGVLPSFAAVQNQINGQPTLTINDVKLTQSSSGTTPFIFTVTLSSASTKTVTVNFATANGTSDAADYTPNNNTLTFKPNETTKTITVSVLPDRIAEPDEIFFVNLSNAANAVIERGQGIGTIVNNNAVTLAVTNPAPNAQVKTNPTIQGTVSGIPANGLSATVDQSTTRISIGFNAQGGFSFTTALSLNGTADGTHVVHFRAVDGGGRITTQDYSFILDTRPPVITISSPAPNSQVKQNPTIQGTVADATTGVASLTARLDSGVAVVITPAADGSFNYTPGLPLDGTADGSHTVHFSAKDGGGNTASKDFTFVLNTKVTANVTINSASMTYNGPFGLTFFSYTVTISGTATGPVGASLVSDSNLAATFGDTFDYGAWTTGTRGAGDPPTTSWSWTFSFYGDSHPFTYGGADISVLDSLSNLIAHAATGSLTA